MEPDAPIQPKTYIRTLAGDMETVKNGGVPEFTQVRERSVVVPIPKAAPLVIETPLIAVPEASLRPVEASGPKVVTEREPVLAPLRTYSGDFSDRVKETGASTATVLAAEQDLAGAPRTTELPEKPSTSNRLYIIGGAVMLIIGVVGVYIAYERYLAVSAPIVVAPVAAVPIFVDDRQKISGTGTALLQNLMQSVTNQIARGSIRLLYFEGATTTSIFTALRLPAPGSLSRNISATNSMAGVIFLNGVQSPFFILSVTSYGETFAGMLQWESTMPRDLAKLFPAYPQPQVATSTTATSTKQKSAPPPVLTPAFRDEVVANHDTRVYRDAAGRVVFLYGYWNQTTLVIARNAASFTEIIGRLGTSRAQP